MLLWIAIVLLLDAGAALWFEPRLARIWPARHVRKAAVIEGFVALGLIILHTVRAIGANGP
ncbi:MAG TPA: hypothetical protein PKC67_11460 [Kiritimatiellia bacterium]|nr:hypothetical protein [Kiritimatiellia bacterium]HMP34956.1 hypothetical protein [Kiritimatiellia bacterium]